MQMQAYTAICIHDGRLSIRGTECVTKCPLTKSSELATRWQCHCHCHCHCMRLFRFDARGESYWPSWNPGHLNGSPAALIFALGPGNLTTREVIHQEQRTRNRRTGRDASSGCWQLMPHGVMVRPPVPTYQSHPLLMLLLLGAHCAPAILPVLGHDAHKSTVAML